MGDVQLQALDVTAVSSGSSSDVGSFTRGIKLHAPAVNKLNQRHMYMTCNISRKIVDCGITQMWQSWIETISYLNCSVEALYC